MRGHKNTFEPRWRCAWCNQPFEAKPSTNQRYCSLECYRKDAFGRKTWKVDFRPQSASERDAVSAQRATPRPAQVYPVRAEGKRWAAMDADAFLEEISESEQARPGHVHG